MLWQVTEAIVFVAARSKLIDGIGSARADRHSHRKRWFMGEGCTAADQKEVLESGWDHPMPLGRNHNEGIGCIDFFCQSLQTAPLRRITANFLVPERQGLFSKVTNPAVMLSKAH
jgi:hypothetical protein